MATLLFLLLETLFQRSVCIPNESSYKKCRFSLTHTRFYPSIVRVISVYHAHKSLVDYDCKKEALEHYAGVTAIDPLPL